MCLSVHTTVLFDGIIASFNSLLLRIKENRRNIKHISSVLENVLVLLKFYAQIVKCIFQLLLYNVMQNKGGLELVECTGDCDIHQSA